MIMNFLEEKILEDGKILNNDILKVDSFLNHQIDPKTIRETAKLMVSHFPNVDKILTIETSGIVIIAVIILTVVGVILLKYNVEGETDLPYIIKQMVIISTEKRKNEFTSDSANRWHIDIYQNTDIFFDIERNELHKSNESIKNITIENIKIDNENVKPYMPSNEGEENFTYIENSIIQDRIIYEVDKNKDIKNKKITTEGGIIGISFCNTQIGKYVGNEDKLTYDGTLLNKLGLKLEDIKAEVKFDLILETEANKKYKAEINLNIPEEDITEIGISKIIDTELKNIVFKRIN